MTLSLNSTEYEVDMGNSRINFCTSKFQFDKKLAMSLISTVFEVDTCNSRIIFRLHMGSCILNSVRLFYMFETTNNRNYFCRLFNGLCPKNFVRMQTSVKNIFD